MLAHTNVLEAYEEGLQEQEPEPLPTHPYKQKQGANSIPLNSPKSKIDNLPPNKGKEKMPPLEWQLPGPPKTDETKTSS